MNEYVRTTDLDRFVKNQTVIHHNYGASRVHEVFTVTKNKKGDTLFNGGVTIEITNKEGEDKYFRDRGGYLPRCFEDNLSFLEDKNVN